MSAVAGTAVEQAQLSGKKLPQPLVNTMANAVTDLTDTASNQQNLVKYFGFLLDKVGILLKVGDEFAKVCLLLFQIHFIVLKYSKIHPYVNFAWQVLSVGLKVYWIYSLLYLCSQILFFEQMVRAQQDRDQKILNLVMTMEGTYSFVDSMEELRKNHVLQDIVEQILKQTIECGYFIQEYMRHNFGGMWRFLFAADLLNGD